MALYPSETTYPSPSTYPSGDGTDPVGGTPPAGSKTWNDVAAQYPTWQAIQDAGITSWDELFDNSGQRFTLVVTPEPRSTPPRVRIDISDTRTTPVTQVTVWRRNPDGKTYTVRTSDAGPIVLSDNKATVYDYEPWYGAGVTYSTDVPGSTPATVVLNVDTIWLVHVGVPTKSVPLHSVVQLGDETRASSRAVYNVLGRPDPVPVASGARSYPAGTLAVRTSTDQQRRALNALLDDDAPVLLNVPADMNWGVNPSYLSLGDTQATRTVRYGPVPLREWTMPYQVIGRPGGGTQAVFTWADVASRYSSWAAIAAAGIDSWTDLATPTN